MLFVVEKAQYLASIFNLIELKWTKSFCFLPFSLALLTNLCIRDILPPHSHICSSLNTHRDLPLVTFYYLTFHTVVGLWHKQKQPEAEKQQLAYTAILRCFRLVGATLVKKHTLIFLSTSLGTDWWLILIWSVCICTDFDLCVVILRWFCILWGLACLLHKVVFGSPSSG